MKVAVRPVSANSMRIRVGSDLSDGKQTMSIKSKQSMARRAAPNEEMTTTPRVSRFSLRPMGAVVSDVVTSSAPGVSSSLQPCAAHSFTSVTRRSSSGSEVEEARSLYLAAKRDSSWAASATRLGTRREV